MNDADIGRVTPGNMSICFRTVCYRNGMGERQAAFPVCMGKACIDQLERPAGLVLCSGNVTAMPGGGQCSSLEAVLARVGRVGVGASGEQQGVLVRRRCPRRRPAG